MGEKQNIPFEQHKIYGLVIYLHNEITTLGKSSVHWIGTAKIAAVFKSFQCDSSPLLKDSLLEYDLSSSYLNIHLLHVSLDTATKVPGKSKCIAWRLQGWGSDTSRYARKATLNLQGWQREKLHHDLSAEHIWQGNNLKE